MKDSKRTEYLESQGFRIIRFWDNDVLKNIDGVLTELSDFCGLGSQMNSFFPHPAPLPRGEVEKKN
jgi:very-short-patch-repair endonuclease